MNSVSRRQFLQTSAVVAAGTSMLTQTASAADSVEYPLEGRLCKTLKIGMVGVKGSLTDKFKAAKAAGFGAIELNAPGFNVEEVNTAVAESGLPVDGSVCASHWQVRHTDADPKVRHQALNTLQEALRTTNAVGGKTVLLVVGRGTDGTEKECWQRSIENISKAIPLAAELGITIAIENVWNHFCYDHDGGADQSADKFVKYVDELNSPFVGMQFDIGNHWKYGPVGDWIRALGKRIVKLDVKGFSREQNKFTKVGEGDIDWLDIRKSLTEINFYGWCAAEVGGGGADRLAEISANMDKAFGLKS
ncbi:MAG: TIM barrel protein [Planctomycetota bacterium]|jgi:hexulose-6-phosphate isomerase